MRILFIGDVFGKAGRKALNQHLRPLIAQQRIDFCVANVENAAGGFGITPAIVDEEESAPQVLRPGYQGVFSQIGVPFSRLPDDALGVPGVVVLPLRRPRPGDACSKHVRFGIHAHLGLKSANQRTNREWRPDWGRRPPAPRTT